MSTRTDTPPLRQDEAAVVGKLSTLDRFLPVWIIAAMALGLLLGSLIPGLNTALEAVKIGEVSLPIAVGLLVMMYPVLAKVRYDQAHRVLADRKLMRSKRTREQARMLWRWSIQKRMTCLNRLRGIQTGSHRHYDCCCFQDNHDCLPCCYCRRLLPSPQ